jgi:hypothetical protein
MPKLKVQIELSEHLYHAYECEATRCGKKIEDLVQKMVESLIREMEREINDPPVFLS